MLPLAMPGYIAGASLADRALALSNEGMRVLAFAQMQGEPMGSDESGHADPG